MERNQDQGQMEKKTNGYKRMRETVRETEKKMLKTLLITENEDLKT